MTTSLNIASYQTPPLPSDGDTVVHLVLSYISSFSTALVMILKYLAKERAMEEVCLPCSLSQVHRESQKCLQEGLWCGM